MSASVFAQPLPPSPSKVRFTTPALIASSSSSSLQADISSPASVTSDSDSDADSDRVFFGSPKAQEGELVARLSRVIPSTPRGRVKKRDSREFMRRQTILLSPRGGRETSEDGDEGEAGEVREKEVKKVWPGGFHERRESTGGDESDYTSSSSSSASSPVPARYLDTPGRRNDDPSDLTFDFSRFRMTDSPLSNTHRAPGTTRRISLLAGPAAGVQSDQKSTAGSETSEEEEEEGEEWTEDEDEDSDKENAPALIEYGEGEEEELKEEYPLFDGPLTGKMMMDSADEEELLRELDMGGLRLSDFADPDFGTETIFVGGGSVYNSDFGLSSREASVDGDRFGSEEPIGDIAVESVVCDARERSDLADDIEERDELEADAEQEDLVGSEAGEEGEEAGEGEADVLEETVKVSMDVGPQDAVIPADNELSETSVIMPENGRSETDSSPEKSLDPALISPSPSPISDLDSDSPLPLARGGPVIIPALAHPSPIRDPGSPFRPFPAFSAEDLKTPELLTLAESGPSRLNSDHSPLSSTPTSDSLLVANSSDTSTPTSRRPLSSTHLAHQSKPPLKSSTLASSILTKLPSPAKRDLPQPLAEARSQKIKDQLSTVFAGKKLGLGAPMRSVSASSSASGSGSGGSRPGSRLGMTEKSTTKGKDKIPSVIKGKNSSISVTGSTQLTNNKTGISAQPRRIPSSSSSIVQPKPPKQAVVVGGFSRRPPTVPVQPARPALAPRSIPPSQATGPIRSNKPIPATMKPARPTTSTTFKAPAQPPVQVRQQAISQPAARSPISTQSNPLKRPLTSSVPIAPARTALTTSGTIGSAPNRPTLGLPARIVRDQVFTLSSTRSAPSPIAQKVPEREEIQAFTAGSVFGPAPVFSLGTSNDIGGGLGMGRATRSPVRTFGVGPLAGGAVRGTPGSVRPYKMGTPSRLKSGTPSKVSGTPRLGRLNGNLPVPTIQVLSTSTAPKDVATVTTSPTNGPPSTNTRHAQGEANGTGQNDSPAGSSLQPGQSGSHRGSSEDHEEVSFVLPTIDDKSSEVDSSPIKTPKDDDPEPLSSNPRDKSPLDDNTSPSKNLRNKELPPSKLPSPTRPKRSTRPPAPSRPNPVASNISEKELKAKTTLNTHTNEKYTCAIDRQIVKKEGKRPVSPSSKIPTTEQREEEGKKADRERRARRRKGEDDSGEGEEGWEGGKKVERVETGVIWRGDDEPWEFSPVDRPTKRARVSGICKQETKAKDKKWVKWDKGLVVIRDDGQTFDLAREVKGDTGEKKSALRQEKQVELDAYGNVLPSRPKEALKPYRVIVQIRVYEGEEPILPPIPTVTAPPPQTGKGRKKSST